MFLSLGVLTASVSVESILLPSAQTILPKQRTSDLKRLHLLAFDAVLTPVAWFAKVLPNTEVLSRYGMHIISEPLLAVLHTPLGRCRCIHQSVGDSNSFVQAPRCHKISQGLALFGHEPNGEEVLEKRREPCAVRSRGYSFISQYSGLGTDVYGYSMVSCLRLPA